MKIGKRNITASIICLILILGTITLASASEAAPSHEPEHEVAPQETHEPLHKAESHEATPEVHEGAGEDHEAEHEGGEHGAGHGPPFVYWFTWVFLLLTMITLVQYLMNTGKETHEGAPGKETKYHSIGYAVMIGIFVVIVVTISLLPSVAHYHESSAVGFARFLLMIITGFLLMAYGFREHERHKLHAHH